MSHRERVVLARRTGGFVDFQWTGAEPDDLQDEDTALHLGARWEGNELVTYDLPGLARQLPHHDEQFQTDND